MEKGPKMKNKINLTIKSLSSLKHDESIKKELTGILNVNKSKQVSYSSLSQISGGTDPDNWAEKAFEAYKNAPKDIQKKVEERCKEFNKLTGG